MAVPDLLACAPKVPNYADLALGLAEEDAYRIGIAVGCDQVEHAVDVTGKY